MVPIEQKLCNGYTLYHKKMISTDQLLYRVNLVVRAVFSMGDGFDPTRKLQGFRLLYTTY
ncbi:hypothetical protein HanIR_Chr12g0587741 [Helianthus annuus]|nr:hypothetical protein HanIR_Chr12g0587741 [Helianthus annuus]